MGEKFQLLELVEIVWQSNNPGFAQLLNRVWEGQQANDDLIQLKGLANTNTATWPDEFVKVYLNKYAAGKEKNDNSILKFLRQISKQILAS